MCCKARPLVLPLTEPYKTACTPLPFPHALNLNPQVDDQNDLDSEPYVGTDPVCLIRPRAPAVNQSEKLDWLCTLTEGDSADFSFDGAWWDVTIVRVLEDDEESDEGEASDCARERGISEDDERPRKRVKRDTIDDLTAVPAAALEAASKGAAGDQARRYVVRSTEDVEHVAYASALRPPIMWVEGEWQRRPSGISSSPVTPEEATAFAREAAALREGMPLPSQNADGSGATPNARAFTPVPPGHAPATSSTPGTDAALSGASPSLVSRQASMTTPAECAASPDGSNAGGASTTPSALAGIQQGSLRSVVVDVLRNGPLSRSELVERTQAAADAMNATFDRSRRAIVTMLGKELRKQLPAWLFGPDQRYFLAIETQSVVSGISHSEGAPTICPEVASQLAGVSPAAGPPAPTHSSVQDPGGAPAPLPSALIKSDASAMEDATDAD